MKKLLLPALLACLFWLSTPGAAKAEWIPTFDLDVEANRATLIVAGEFDETGELAITEVFKGRAPAAKLTLPQGDKELFALLSGAMKASGSLRVVLFLDGSEEKNRRLTGRTGLAGFDADGVYLFLGASDGFLQQRQPTFINGGYAKHSTFTPATFLAALKNALAAEREREHLLALPHSAMRMQTLLDFLFRQKGGYHWHRVARALRPIESDEEPVILHALRHAARQRNASAQEKQIRLLSLLRIVAPNEQAFPEVARFVGRAHFPKVRSAAIWTLNAIDSHRASSRFAALLSLDDPELLTLISALSPDSSSEQRGLFNKAAVEPLLRLSQTLRQRPAAERGKWSNAESALLYQLKNFGHPRLLLELRQWTLHENQIAREHAMRQLNELTGLNFSTGEAAALNAWWQEAAPLLQTQYFLDTAAGRRAWLVAYQKADAATQRILMRLWFFERAINEAGLLQDASRRDEYSRAAKIVLSELWQRKRLSAQCRRDIVARFVTVRLVHLPDPSPSQHLEFQIVALRDFPFPADSWVDYGYCVAVGDEKLRIDNTGNSRSLEGFGPIVLGSRGGGILQGPRIARAAMEVREIDHYNLRERGKVLWSQRWTLAPLPLADE